MASHADTRPLEPMAEGAELPVFEEEAPGPLKRLQHFLHAYPTTVPFIVLLLGVALFAPPSVPSSSTPSICP